MYSNLAIWLPWVLLLGGCKATKEQAGTVLNPSMELSQAATMIVLKAPVRFTDQVVFDKTVTIYPEAYISTSGNGKVIFNKGVNILGGSQVFDADADVEFGEGCLGTLNVGWFGARGYDREDDTDAFQKALAIASAMYNSVNVFVPIGKYHISSQLVMENKTPLNKSINLVGEAMSTSSNDGSSLIWNGTPGAAMILVRNNYSNLIASLDFAAEPQHELKHNIELRPQIYQMEFRDCAFSGCAGEASSNINLNEGSSVQVSEISVMNCVFRSKTVDNKNWLTESAIKGGKANTKNFYFEKCSFMGYTEAAINIEISDIISISNCAFAHNQVDIICLLCNLLATSNYSEQSTSFFKSTLSSNLAFTTLINNFFDGNEREDYVIPEGAGSLVIVNNNFGGSGGMDSTNLIRWDSRNISSIYSVGNYFRNGSSASNPFNLSGSVHLPQEVVKSIWDKVGTEGATSIKVKQ